MAIVTLSEALLQRLTATDGRILRDRVLCGFCLKAGKRSRSFMVATSCGGRQIRLHLGRWPLLSVEEARSLAVAVLKDCRAGIEPIKHERRQLPTLEQAISEYAEAKGIKATSLRRYQSILRTHFGALWQQPVSALTRPDFASCCHEFALTKGAALVEVGRGLIGALLKYLNAVHSLNIRNPFQRLADAGLMPARAQPRPRRLQEADLPAWRAAVDRLPELQRDYLMLLILTGLRRNECKNILPEHIDRERGILHIPDTKNGRPHSLPITPMMAVILDRRGRGLEPARAVFAGVAVEHVHQMAERLGGPKFMLHDLRKLVATVGERLTIGDALLRRILNHTAKRSDVLYRHYVSTELSDIEQPLVLIQVALNKLMQQQK